MKKLDIVFYRKYIISLTAVSVFAAFLFLILISFNKSIEFSGGFVFEVSGDIDKNTIYDIFGEKVSIYDADHGYVVKMPYLENHTFDSVKAEMSNLYNVESASMVSPSMTDSLIKKSFLAVFFSVATVFIYLFLRFNLYYSFGSILTITHDIILTVAFIKIMHIELSITTIAAILTIIGYSVNDTVIIYDKIRSHFTIKSSLPAVINASINETLPRTIGTSLTTILSIVPIAVLTKGQIYDFAIIVIFGILIGTISSIAVSALSLLPFEEKIRAILELKKKIGSA
jgi:preprotein translocase SecF subunit